MSSLSSIKLPELPALPKQVTPKKKKLYQFRDWVFTQFLDAKWDVATALKEQEEFHKIFPVLSATAGTYQLERCPTTHRLHFQGRFTLQFRTTIKAIQDLLRPIGRTFSFLQAEKDYKSSVKYASKPSTREGGPWEVTVPPPVTVPRVVEYWYGEPGNGKSTAARALMQSLNYRVYEPCKADASKGVWLNDYKGEEGVIMDEVTQNWFSESNWKKILDTMPQTVASGSGGRTVRWEPKMIIMIANTPPPTLFTAPAFARRINTIRHITNPAYPQKQTQYLSCDSSFWKK